MAIGVLVSFSPTATETVNAAGAGFSISPVYPSNDVGRHAGSFNVLAQPGTLQDLAVKLVNNEDKDRTIQIQLNTAYTSTDGSLQYSLQKKELPKDNTIRYYISDLVPKPRVQNVKIKAKSSGYVTFQLQIPKTGWNGYLLGGFFAMPVNENTETTTQKGTLLRQKFGLSIPVALRTNKNYQTSINLRLNAIRPKMLPGNVLGVGINVQNTRPWYTQNNLDINAKITRKGSKKVLHQKSLVATSFAPNSNYDYGVSWQGKPLEPGKYHLSWKSSIGGVKNWNFERDFTISNADAQRLNNEAGFKPNYLWLWILLAILLIILIGTVAYYYGRKKNQQSTTGNKACR